MGTDQDPGSELPLGNAVGWAPNCRMRDSSSLLGTDCELNTDHAATTSTVRTATHIRSSRSLSLLGELQPLVVAEEAAHDSQANVLRDPLPGQLVRGPSRHSPTSRRSSISGDRLEP
jgi:hypothetical protein